ncbi:rRNA methyltransferase 1, mitochondrial-like [Ornithodoros turicata]|uniref:rRNA methyltransferase 1, mitochondrial-like n=1 Tax=Ornithodoros turicata TaxID=34597 RepID=UPI00313A1B69
MNKLVSWTGRRVHTVHSSFRAGYAVRPRDAFVSGVDLLEMDSGSEKLRRAPVLAGPKQSSKRPSRKINTIEVKGDLIFGLYPTLLALQARKREFYSLYVKKSKLKDDESISTGVLCEIMKLANEQGLVPQPVSGYVLSDLMKGEVHQGVILEASHLIPVDQSQISASDMEVMTGRCPVWLLLDRIQDPMNFGAVLRSSYYFGVKKIFTMKDESCRLSPIVSKASSGALELLDIYCLTSTLEFLEALKSKGWTIVGTSAEPDCANSCPLHEASVLLSQKHVLLIMGNEGKGVQPSLRSLCDVNIFVQRAAGILPSMGSLNVSVATGIVLHQLCQGRR